MVSERIKEIVASYHKSNLINILNDMQKEDGFLSEEAIDFLSKEIKVPVAQIFSMASFYSFLRFESKDKKMIHLCDNPSCYLNGSEDILRSIEKVTGLRPGQSNERFVLKLGSCIGCCDEPPAMMFDGRVYTRLSEGRIRELLESKK